MQTTTQSKTDVRLSELESLKTIYLKYAAQIDFYYRPEVQEKPILAATWTRESNLSERGILKILNQAMIR